MGDFGRELKNFFRKGDMILLILCLSISFLTLPLYHGKGEK